MRQSINIQLDDNTFKDKPGIDAIVNNGLLCEGVIVPRSVLTALTKLKLEYLNKSATVPSGSL